MRLVFRGYKEREREREDTRQPRNTSCDKKINTKFFVSQLVFRGCRETLFLAYIAVPQQVEIRLPQRCDTHAIIRSLFKVVWNFYKLVLVLVEILKTVKLVII